MGQSTQPPRARQEELDALVLAGGAGRRLGGTDKCSVEIAGRTLLAWALNSVAAAGSVVVVGPDRGLPAPLLQAREEPSGGGPVAAIAAGVRRLQSQRPEAAPARSTVVVACDMPRVGRAAVERLVTALASPGAQAAVYVEGDGRQQHFPAAFAAGALEEALAGLGEPAGAAVRDLLSRLTVVGVPADPGLTADCDTWDDVARARLAMEGR